MRFPGYWVDGEGASVTVERYVFDDTELSPESAWKEAYQNEDPSASNGFVDPQAMLTDVCRRLLKGEGPGSSDASEGNIRDSEPMLISSVHDLARLVLRVTGADQNEEHPTSEGT